MKSVSKREKIMLIALVVLGIFYLYYHFFFSPYLTKTANLKSSISNYTVQVESYKQAVIVNEKLKTELNDLNLKFADSVKQLPQYERDPEIAYNIKSLGGKNGVTINTISISLPTELTIGAGSPNTQVTQQPDANNQSNNQASNQSNTTNQSAGPKLYTIPVNLSANGSYNNLKGFILSIENDTRIADIVSVNLTTDQTGSLAASITINYYYYDGNVKGEIDYGFNKGAYGKQDLFK